MKEKILTKGIITVIITVLLIILGMENIVNAEAITIKNAVKTSYSLNLKSGIHPIYKFSESSGNYKNLYCLNGGADRDTGDVVECGTNLYNLDENTITTIFGTKERYNSAMWFIDNMYIANVKDDTNTVKAMMIENITNIVKNKKDLIEKEYTNEKDKIVLDETWIEGMMADYATREDLINVVQQCVLWNFTNNRIQGIGEMKPESIISSEIIPGDGKDNSNEYRKTKYYCYIYTAMKSAAEDHSNYIPKNTEKMKIYLNDITLDSENAKVDRENKKIGPFTLKNYDASVPEFTKYSVEINDENLPEENYDIIKDGNNIYVQLKNDYELNNTNEYLIKLNIDMKVITTDTKFFYTAGNLTTKQPLANIDKSILSKKVEASVNEPAVDEFDLALTKEIVNVEYKMKNDTDSKEIKDRLKSYQVSGLTDGTTALYIMNKPALKVKTGAIVRYKITVYNESDINGYATEITDYLPSGLEYKSDSEPNKSNGWIATKNSDGTTTVKTNKLKNRELLAYTGGEKLDSDYVEIECNVVAEDAGKVLTNVSEISKYGYYVGTDFIEQ